MSSRQEQYESSWLSTRRIAVRAGMALLGFVVMLLTLVQPAQAAHRPSLAALLASEATVVHLPDGRIARRAGTGDLSAQTITSGTLRNRATGRCVDDSFAVNLRPFSCNGQNFQTWFFEWDGVRTIRNANTNRCIDDSIAFGLRSFTCNGLPFQAWTNWIVSDSNGTFLGDAFSNDDTNHCIDDSVAFGLRSFACNFEDFQLFT